MWGRTSNVQEHSAVSYRATPAKQCSGGVSVHNRECVNALAVGDNVGRQTDGRGFCGEQPSINCRICLSDYQIRLNLSATLLSVWVNPITDKMPHPCPAKVWADGQPRAKYFPRPEPTIPQHQSKRNSSNRIRESLEIVERDGMPLHEQSDSPDHDDQSDENLDLVAGHLVLLDVVPCCEDKVIRLLATPRLIVAEQIFDFVDFEPIRIIAVGLRRSEASEQRVLHDVLV